MLGDSLNKIILFLSTKKLVFSFLVFVFFCVSIVGLIRINIEESIFSTLPQGESFSKFSQLIEEGDLSNQIVFSIAIKNIETENLEDLTTAFKDSLNSYAKKYVKDIVINRLDVQNSMYNHFYNNFSWFIDDDYYQTIEVKLATDSLRLSLKSSYRNLLSPSGAVFKEFILKDPIYITSNFFKQLGDKANMSRLNFENGYVFSEDMTELIITAKANYPFSNNKKNVILNDALKAFKVNWDAKYSANKIDFFGTFQIGAENGEQVKQDTFFTLIITLIVILLILFIFYRKILIPLYFMLPLIFGGLFALGVIGFIKPNVSGISIAAGAVVFGIVMDFTFHFFTHLKHTKSINETVKDISFPLLTGAFTTLMAFGALLFTNSVVLQDFGLFAALSIFGSALFTVTGLPIMLRLFNFNYTALNRQSREFNFSIPPQYRKIFTGLIGVLTCVFFYFSFDIQFDDNLENLSIHSDELKIKEEKYAGINPEKETKIYLFAESASYETASQSNYRLYKEIQVLQEAKKIKSSLSAANYIIPDSIISYRTNRWDEFWKDHKDSMVSDFDALSDSLGFNEQAFSSFKNWISRTNIEQVDQEELYQQIGINDLISKHKDKTTFITTVVVDKGLVKEIQKRLTKIEGVSAFNKAEVATELLSIVKSDFNYILIVSSLLVFISLLIIYGRIELALFTFIPMVISWIWILGIAAIFNIQFNFVNIIIATFIFGLGDDFSIFVTDGLLSKYKYNKNSLGSYNTAIILSAITTMVGTGVLFFAKHPAIKSVSVISVLGILCILMVSLTVQPLLFELFIQNRVEKKKTPVTLIALLVSVFEFPWFVLGCIVAYVVLGILIILPFPKRKKRYFLNRFLSLAAKSVIYLALHVKKKIFNKQNLDLKNPSIIIANHTSFLDILLLLMLSPKIIIMVKGWVYNSILFGPLVRYVGYIYVGDDPMEDLKTIQLRIDEGYSLAIFPEGSRSETDEIRRMHKGAFYLAQELNLDITPILIHGASYTLPKSEYFVKHGHLNLKVLPRIKAGDTPWGNTFGKRTKSISSYFKHEYSVFKDEQENGKSLFSRVFANYVFKGPILEWYVKIKWKLEVNNFEYYNSLVKDKPKVLDIGCGYGYLSYFLHYKNPNHTITGFDYDEEKISIAQNGFDKSENLKFRCVDINTEPLLSYDAIILNDVLHYFSKEKQLLLLDKCAKSLKENGIILIRDGVTDFKEKHEKTRLTETLSTQFLSFNKKEENFHFFSISDINTFAAKHNLLVKMHEHSKNTSNVLFTLKKQ